MARKFQSPYLMEDAVHGLAKNVGERFIIPCDANDVGERFIIPCDANDVGERFVIPCDEKKRAST